MKKLLLLSSVLFLAACERPEPCDTYSCIVDRLLDEYAKCTNDADATVRNAGMRYNIINPELLKVCDDSLARKLNMIEPGHFEKGDYREKTVLTAE